MHGRDEVVVVSAGDYEHLRDDVFGAALVAATALHHRLTVVSPDVREFRRTGTRTFGPWQETMPAREP